MVPTPQAVAGSLICATVAQIEKDTGWQAQKK